MKAVVAAVAAGLAVVVGACAQASRAEVKLESLDLVAQDGKATTLEIVDLGKTGFGPSDQMVEEAPLTDEDGSPLGESYTIVTMTSGKGLIDAKGIIDCSINLDAGSIFFSGYVAFADLGKGATVPIVGGTGDYEGAGGTVTLTAPDDKHTTMSFDLLIPITEDE